jgi:hypothetical protein
MILTFLDSEIAGLNTDILNAKMNIGDTVLVLYIEFPHYHITIYIG